MDRHERRLAAFLAGALDQDAARAFDEHLLSCEACWDAVRADRAAREAAERSRAAVPAQLAGRVRLAVELAAAQAPPRRRTARRTLAAGAGLLATALLAIVSVLVLPSRSPATPAPLAAVVQYARLLPTASGDATAHTGSPTEPIPLAGPLNLGVEGTRIALRYYAIGTVEVVVATADHSFPEPSGARAQGGAAMAWSASLNGVSLYCPSSRVLLAAPIPVDQLTRIAARIPAG